MLISGFSEWSILWMTLASSGAFTVANLMAEIIFKMVNNQNQVYHDGSALGTIIIFFIFPECDWRHF